MANPNDLVGIVNDLKQRGYTNEQIRQALQQPKVPSHHLDAITTIVGIGLLLVVMAIVIIITSQWEMLGPWGKIMLILVPIGILYLIASLTSNRPEQHEITRSTFTLATFLLPVLFGTTVFQLNIYHQIDSTLIGWSALVGWVAFYLLEIVWQKKDLAPITLLYLIAAYSSFVARAEPAQNLTFWLFALFGIGLIVVAQLMRRSRPESAAARLAFGSVIALVSAPIALIINMGDDWQLTNEAMITVMLVVGLLFWLGSLLIDEPVGAKDKWSEVVSQLKTALAEIGWLMIAWLPFGYLEGRPGIIPLLAIYSYLITLLSIKLPYRALIPAGSLALLFALLNMSGFSAYQSPIWMEQIYPVLAVIAGLGLIAASIKIKIETYLPIGAIAVVVGILHISQQYFVNTLGWPITIFVLGLLFIALGVVLNHIGRWRQEQAVVYRPLVDWHFTGNSVSGTAHPTTSASGGCLRMLGIVLGLILVVNIIGFIISNII